MFSEVRARLQSTIGGSSETEEKLFAVKPMSTPPGPDVVTIVTPVAKDPKASRNARPSKTGPPLARSACVDGCVVILGASCMVIDAAPLDGAAHAAPVSSLRLGGPGRADDCLVRQVSFKGCQRATLVVQFFSCHTTECSGFVEPALLRRQ